MHKLKSTNKLYCNKQQDSVRLHVGELLDYGMSLYMYDDRA